MMLTSLIKLLELIAKKNDGDREAVIAVVSKIAEHANSITITWTDKLSKMDNIYLKMQNAKFSMENKTVSMLIDEEHISVLSRNPLPNSASIYRMDEMLEMTKRHKDSFKILNADPAKIADELEKFLDIRNEAFVAYTDTFSNIKYFSDEFFEQSIRSFDIEKFREIVIEMQRQAASIEMMCDSLRLPNTQSQ